MHIRVEGFIRFSYANWRTLVKIEKTYKYRDNQIYNHDILKPIKTHFSKKSFEIFLITEIRRKKDIS